MPMSAEEYKKRLEKSLVSSFHRGAVEHPSLPLMSEKHRELTKIFGEIFNLYPPAGDTRYDKLYRQKWGNWLDHASKATDGTRIPNNKLKEIWGDLSTGKLMISGPQSVIKPTQAEYARRSR